MAQCNHVVLSTTVIANPPAGNNEPYESVTTVDNMPMSLGVCDAERGKEGSAFPGTYGHFHCNPAGTEVIVSTYNSAGCTGSINTTYTQAQMITHLNEFVEALFAGSGTTLTYSVTGIECKQQEPCAKFKRNCATGCGSTVLEADCDDSQMKSGDVGVCIKEADKSYVWKSDTNQDVKDTYIQASGSTMATCVGTDSVKLQNYADNDCQTKTTSVTLSSGCNNDDDVEMLVKCEIDGTAKEAPPASSGAGSGSTTTAAPAPVSGARGRISGLMMAAMTAAVAVAMVTM